MITKRKSALNLMGVFCVAENAAIGAQILFVLNNVFAREVVKRRAAMYRQRGVGTVFGDQRESYLLESAYRSEGIHYVPLVWTSESKPRAVERLRRFA